MSNNSRFANCLVANLKDPECQGVSTSFATRLIRVRAGSAPLSKRPMIRDLRKTCFQKEVPGRLQLQIRWYGLPPRLVACRTVSVPRAVIRRGGTQSNRRRVSWD